MHSNYLFNCDCVSIKALIRKEMKTPRINSFVRLLFFNFFFVLCGVVVLEIIFGNWFSPNRMNRLNLVRNTTYVQNIDGKYPSSSKMFRYSRDQYGLRGKYSALDKIDVLVVGGSTTDERVISDEKTWTSVLQDTLASEKEKFVVVNAGVSGQSKRRLKSEREWRGLKRIPTILSRCPVNGRIIGWMTKLEDADHASWCSLLTKY